MGQGSGLRRPSQRDKRKPGELGPRQGRGASVSHMKVINGLDRGGRNKTVRDGGVSGVDSSAEKFASEMLMEGRGGALGGLPRSRA